MGDARNVIGITNRFAGAYSHELNEDLAQIFSMQNLTVHKHCSVISSYVPRLPPLTRWWFQICFIFIPTWGDDPF